MITTSPFLVAVLGAAPLLVALVLLLVARLPGVRAGAAAWGVAVAVAALPGPYHLEWPALLAANARGVLISLIVLYVLLAGLLLYNLLERAGAISRIARALGTATRDPARQALVVTGGLSPFFESVSGFGLAVVIVAPLFLALGFGTRRATVLALLGQNAVPWGAMAIGTLVGAELAGLPAEAMGVGSAYLNVPLAFLYNALAVAVAAGPALVLSRLPDIVLTSAVLAGGLLAFSARVSVELAGVLAGLLAAGAELAFARLVERSTARAAKPASAPGVSLAAAFAPYYVLIAGLLASRLVPPISAWLTGRLVLEAPAYGFHLPLVYSPAFFLLVASAAAVVVFRPAPAEVLAALRGAVRQWWPAAGATTAFLALSAVMYAAGMTPRLAAAAAAATGPTFALLSPFVGGMGGLMTGSNTGGNAMLIQFQVETARRAGLPPDVLAFANNVAAANATMASPARVALAAAVTGQGGREGMVLRSVLLPVVAATVVIALHVALWVRAP